MRDTDKVNIGSETHGNSHEPESPPAYLQPLNYDSYDKLKEAVNGGFNDGFYKSEIGAQYPKIAEAFERFITSLRQDGVPVPLFGGERIKLKSQADYPTISLFISSAYDLPWIWYYPFVETGENFFIRIAVIPETVSDELRNGSPSDLIRSLSPLSPNTDNYKDIPEIKRVYEREVSLRDRKVVSLIYEYENDPRENTVFIYDGMLVTVRADTDIRNEQWFSRLSFER